MRTLFKVLIWLLAGASVLTVAAVALAFYLVNRSQPDYGATLAVDGLTTDVQIVRDAFAVPHIYADSDEDAYFALGLAHAQDRLWQMELSRRGAQGRLSEIFGAAALSLDKRMRVFDLHTIARKSLGHQTPETRAALEAYAKGVNAWIRTVNEQARGRGAPEFFLFGNGLAPWTPTDSLAVLKVMALRLTGSAEREIKRAKLLRQLPPEKVDDLFPEYPDAGLMALPAFASAYPGMRFRAFTHRAAATPLDEIFLPRARMAGASNAWAVDGARATTGAPLLANDPHLWLSAPSLWMLAHIEFPDKGVIGGSIPGIPAIIVGRNRSVAWGLTNVGMDDQDVYIEKLNPENPNEYLTPSGWAAFQTRKDLIPVKDSDPVEITLRWTRHGPVMPADLYDVGAVTPVGHVAALSWSALSEEDRSLSAIMRLNRVNSVEEAVEAGADMLAPAQNVTVADARGVGIYVAGRAPMRKSESRSRGRIPGLGWIAANDWDGLAPAYTTPRALRPRSGIVANANNRVTNAPFPDHISSHWATPYRIRRIEQRLNAREFHTRESFIELQNDSVSEMARSVLPLIGTDFWWTRDESNADEKANRRDAVLSRLGDWNGEMSEHAPEPLIFTAWMRALTRRIAGDELGEALSEVEGPRPLFVERVFRNVNGAAVWCDIDKTTRVETCAEVAKLALDDALEELSAAYGENPDTWRWGEAHRARHAHTPLGTRFPFDLFVNIEHETSGGDYTILRAQTAGKGPEPYLNIHAGGYRAVYDFADLDRSVFVIATGQSGHVLSSHYDDQAERWRSGGYIPMTMNRDDIEAGASGTTTLRPRRPD